MSLQFDRTTIVFFVFVVIIAAIFGINQLVLQQPPHIITVATDPLAEEWVRATATRYNATNPVVNRTTPVTVRVQVIDDLDVWRGNTDWTATDHPHAWIPSSSASVTYLPPNLPFVLVEPTLATTPLVWGAFRDRADLITDDGQQRFSWSAVQPIAAAEQWAALGADGGFVNMAINWPASSMAGVEALTEAVAAYHQTSVVTADQIDDLGFEAWFDPIADTLTNAQRIGGSPAQALASRGKSVADYALLPESQWLMALDGLTAGFNFVFAYPSYQTALDFPLARWDDSATTERDQAAIDGFLTFLRGAEGQQLAVDVGLRPAHADLATLSAPLFLAGEPFGIQIVPQSGVQVEKPPREVAEALIRLLTN